MSKAEKLIARAFELRAQRDELALALTEIETAIIALGAGKHPGAEEGQEITVVAAGLPLVSYKFGSKELETARELCGEAFGKVFDRVVSFEPCKSFAEVAPKVLPKAVASKILALGEKQTAGKRAYVLYPRAPK